MNKWDQFVYSYVPKSALDSVLFDGLYSGEALLKRPDLLNIAAKSKNLSPKQLEKEIKKNLSSWAKDSSKGPNIIFSLIPDSIKLSKKHPTKIHKLIPIKINLTELLSDYPNTKIFGMELSPYIEGISTIEERHHFLTPKEISKFLSMSSKELWSTYNDINDQGLYAPDVPHACIQIENGIIPAKYIVKINKTASEKNIIPHQEALKILDQAKEKIKSTETIQNLLKKYKLDEEIIDLIPMCFAELDVSARTDKGIIYFNNDMFEDPDEIPAYMSHEITHVLQQCFSDGPTKGSTDDTYLDNKYEQEGFRTQTEFISETEDDDAAEEYIDQVLEYHDVPEKEINKRKKQLLQFASKEKQLSLPEERINKSKEELLQEYDEAIRKGPQAKHLRREILRSLVPQHQKKSLIDNLKKVIDSIENNKDNPVLQKRIDRRKQLQLLLDE